MGAGEGGYEGGRGVQVRGYERDVGLGEPGLGGGGGWVASYAADSVAWEDGEEGGDGAALGVLDWMGRW